VTAVCIDTHVLIWGIKQSANQGQEDLIPRASELLSSCKKNNEMIIVPSVVAAEFLTGIPHRDHGQVIKLLSSFCHIQPFDANCASLHAKLWQEKQDSGIIQAMRSSDTATRQEIKADCMIVSTALANNARFIYTHDRGLTFFAQGSIECREIPNIPVQGELLNNFI